MDTVKNIGNYVAESVQGATATASKETNKEVAKDGNASVGTRINAGTEAVKDFGSEQGHSKKADLHKEAAKH